MKVEVISVTENEDGSATAVIEADKEFTELAVQNYLTHILERACDEADTEYSIVRNTDDK